MAAIGRAPVGWRLLLLLAVVAPAVTIAFLVGRQSGRPDGAAPPADAAAATAAAKARYYCPMHPGMVSDRPGDCPICSMRMVPMEEAPAGEAQAAATPQQAGRKKILYRSTMRPDEVSDRPGKDSMGMDMVPVEVEDAVPGSSAIEGLAAVRIPSRKQQLIGIRTTVVRRAPFVRTIRAVGRVTADETRLHHVHTKIEGWIERLNVDATGQYVRKGEPLLGLYSPELLATQEEYLLALRTRREMAEEVLPEVARRADELVESSRKRLLLYDLTPAQIDELERTGTPSRTVTLYSPITGYVTKRNVSHGEKIDPGTTLLDLADLSRIWVIASIYEYELPFVKVGQKAAMSLSYLPGQKYEGTVTFIYPVLEGATRTAQVRLEFPNPSLALKPEMYAEVELMGDLGERLSVPEGAVLSSGTRDVVFVAKGEGYFEPREVRLGLRLPDAIEVLDGLADGDEVVTSGTFFIDSESKLKAALEAAAGGKPQEHRH